MEIEIQKIVSGSYDGQRLWICDLRYNDYHKKPIRHIKPTEVLVVSKNEVSKKIYYSNSCFLKLNKKGIALKSSIIPLFDNTGYRSYTGVALNCFDNKEECIACYKSQINKAISELEKHLKYVTSETKNKIAEFQNLANDL